MKTEIRMRAFLVVLLAALGASAPVSAGPWIETARLVHSGGSLDDGFGASVAIDGDVAVVGESVHLDGSHVPGVAYVFVRSGGAWSEAASLVPSDSANDDRFGNSVAISGDTIVVGAPLATVGDVATEGEAYVFVRPVGGWSGTLNENARLGNFNGLVQNVTDRLGFSVSVSGRTVAVGAPGGSLAGLVFVFTVPRSGWSGAIPPSAVLSAPSAIAAGFSVGISGDVVVAGAPGTGGFGAAYVWTKPPAGWSGTLTESADLAPASPFPNSQIGDSIAIDGNTVVVGAPFAQYTTSEGVAYVFVQPATGWTGTLDETARLVPSSDKLNSDSPKFGESISISSETVVVGTPGLRVFKFSQGDGGAFIFRRPASGWSGDVGEQAKILRVDAGAQQSELGSTVSISGQTIILGAPTEFVDGNSLQGAAHVFEPGLNPTVTAAFSPGSVLTFQPSTLSLTVTNPNTTGFIWNLGIGTPLFPSNLFIAGTPASSTSCGGFFVSGSTTGDQQLFLDGGDPMFGGGSCTVSANVSSLIPGPYTTSALPVTCDQGCDGVGSGPAKLLVRLRLTQIRFLVEGPVRVAPGVPVEFRFKLSAERTSLVPTGEVVVSDGAGHSCRSDVSSAGQGSCSLTFGSPGTFVVRAQYLGNLSFRGSTSPAEPVRVRAGAR
ncbi:MAG: Ig-like domain repeat protein [Thermoanaerobaculia bacterium]